MLRRWDNTAARLRERSDRNTRVRGVHLLLNPSLRTACRAEGGGWGRHSYRGLRYRLTPRLLSVCALRRTYLMRGDKVRGCVKWIARSEPRVALSLNTAATLTTCSAGTSLTANLPATYIFQQLFLPFPTIRCILPEMFLLCGAPAGALYSLQPHPTDL